MIILQYDSYNFVQYNNRGSFCSTVKMTKDELVIRAENDKGIFETIVCRFKLPDLAIKWSYDQFSNLINEFKIYKQYSRISLRRKDFDGVECFYKSIEGKIPFTSDWYDKYCKIDLSEKPLEIDGFLVKDNKTQEKKVLKRMFTQKQVACHEFQIQDFLKKNPHPNILQYNNHHVDQNKQYISQDYYGLGTLKDIFNQFRNGVPILIAKEITKQLLEGLDHLHLLGIIHRYINPENIIITNIDQIQVKINNFSQAVLGESLERFYGKKGYVAPEVVNRFIHDDKCDIYSVGLIFYELLIGQVVEKPFSGQINFTKLNQLRLNTQAIDLVQQMLEPDPIKRLNVQDCLGHDFFKRTPPTIQIGNFLQSLNQEFRC